MTRYYILILEDDLVTSVALTKALQNELPDTHILRATSLFEARLLTASFDIQFFLLDIKLPDGNGIDLVLDISSRSPLAGVAIMTADALPKHRDRASSYGALHFYEKPVPPRNLAQVIRTHRTATPASDTSFTASLSRLGVLEVIQLKCLARASLRLDFRLSNGRFGSVYLDDGQIIHAETSANTDAETTTGMPALAEILAWRGGRIEEVKDQPPPKPTLEGNWQGILLEAAQLFDELEGNKPS